MAIQICVEKSKKTRTRKVPMLPRIGIVVEVGGRKFTYRQSSITEALLNLRERGFSMKNLMKVASEQLSEIKLPNRKVGI